MNKKLKITFITMLTCLMSVFVCIAWNCKTLGNNASSNPQEYSESQTDYYQRIDEYITRISKILSETEEFKGLVTSSEQMKELRTMKELRAVMRMPMRFSVSTAARQLELHRLYEATEAMKVELTSKDSWKRNTTLIQLQLEIMKQIRQD